MVLAGPDGSAVPQMLLWDGVLTSLHSLGYYTSMTFLALKDKLFSPLVSTDKLHPHVKSILDRNDIYIQEVIKNWADGFVDRDNKFAKEFQTTFSSCLWELYIFAVLKELNLSVDFSYHAPDFVITGERPFNIEAKISNNAEESTPEHDFDYKLQKLIDPNDQIDVEKIFDIATARHVRSLAANHSKYKSSYKELEHAKRKPFVIAIAPFEQPFFYFQGAEAISRVLYASKLTFEGYRPFESIMGNNGSRIPLGYFTNDRMKEISAVLFSPSATMGKLRALSRDPDFAMFKTLRYGKDPLVPVSELLLKKDYHESLMDGLHIFHNPYAETPLNYKIFDRAEVLQHRFDISSRIPIDDHKEGALIVRQVITNKARQMGAKARGGWK